MKVTKEQLKQLIKEELGDLLLERPPENPDDPDSVPDRFERDFIPRGAERGPIAKAVKDVRSPEAVKKAKERAIMKINAMAKLAMQNSPGARQMLFNIAYGDLSPMNSSTDDKDYGP